MWFAWHVVVMQADGWTPLISAILLRRTESVVALVGAGAAVNQAVVSVDGGAMGMFARGRCGGDCGILCLFACNQRWLFSFVWDVMKDVVADGWSDAPACGDCEWAHGCSCCSSSCRRGSEPGYGAWG